MTVPVKHRRLGGLVKGVVLLLCSATLATAGLAQAPLDGSPVAGEKSLVATLGTVHLSGHPDWDKTMLDPLLAKLERFRPTIITHEGMSGEQCYAMRGHPDLYAEIVEAYCWDPSSILADTRLSVPQALLEIRRAISELPSEPDASDRRRLAVLFLAAGDRASAKVQWLRLKARERIAEDGITSSMIELLERGGKAMNESYDIAAALAARLGHDRVYAVDDHTSGSILTFVGQSYVEELTERYDDPAIKRYLANDKARTDAVVDGNTLLNLYRQLNGPDGSTQALEADFAGALRLNSPQLSGRKYIGWWEVRNLRMIANVRATFATRPGARVLNIVGASHKPWYDFLLGTMPDVRVMPSHEILR